MPNGIAWFILVCVVLGACHVAADTKRHKPLPVTPYTTRIDSQSMWIELIRTPYVTPQNTPQRRMVLVHYTSSWCGRACTASSAAYADVAKYFARMKIFHEVVIAECIADEVGASFLADEDRILQYPAVVLYAPHIESTGRSVFNGSYEREAMIDFTKDHLLRMHEYLRDL